MASDRIIVQFLSSGVWIMAVKMSSKDRSIVFSSFSAIEDGRITAAVLDRLKTAVNIQRSKVVMILPQRQVIYKYFALPSKDKNELRRMVLLQVGQGLAFSPEEIIYDLAVAGQNEQGLSQVVVAITRQKTVEHCLSVANASGLHVSRAMVSAFGICAWLSERFDSLTPQCVIAVDLQPESLEFCVCQHKQLLFVRAIPLSETGTALAFAQQMDVTLASFQRTYPQINPSKIILTGVHKNRETVKTVLIEKLQIPCEEADVENNGPDDSPDVSLCAAVGISKAKEWKLDLMPSSAHQVSSLYQEKMALLRVFAALMLFVLVLIIVNRGQNNSLERQLQNLRRVISQNKDQYQKARRNLVFYEMITDDQNHKVIMAELFKEVYAALPASVVLTNLQYADGNLTVLGQTKESADVGAVQKALMGSPMFTDVTLQYANRPQRLGMDFTEFKMVCHLKTAANEGS